MMSTSEKAPPMSARRVVSEVERARDLAQSETARKMLDEIARFSATWGLDRALLEHFERFVQRGEHR